MMNLQEIQLNQVSTIYLGKDNCCRCGCGGKYVSTSYMKEPRSVVDDNAASRLLKRAKKLALNLMNDVDYGTSYINVSYGNNRAICIYLDELK